MSIRVAPFWGMGGVHGMSLGGCHSMDMDAMDEVSLLLCSPCGPLFLTAPCLPKTGPTMLPPIIMGPARTPRLVASGGHVKAFNGVSVLSLLLLLLLLD